MLLFTVTITRIFGSGPMWWRFNRLLDNCDNNWWQHLLFINNIYPTEYKKQCLPWTWYLADDFQFFIIGLLLIILFTKNKTWGINITLLIWLICTIITMIITNINDIDPTSKLYQNEIYDKPYSRIMPYLIGLFTCFLFNTEKPIIKNHYIVL